MRAGRLDKAQRLYLKKKVSALVPHMWAIPVHIVIHNHASGYVLELEESSGIYQNMTFLWH